jgi:hypothetical protein
MSAVVDGLVMNGPARVAGARRAGPSSRASIAACRRKAAEWRDKETDAIEASRPKRARQCAEWAQVWQRRADELLSKDGME